MTEPLKRELRLSTLQNYYSWIGNEIFLTHCTANADCRFLMVLWVPIDDCCSTRLSEMKLAKSSWWLLLLYMMANCVRMYILSETQGNPSHLGLCAVDVSIPLSKNNSPKQSICKIFSGWQLWHIGNQVSLVKQSEGLLESKNKQKNLRATKSSTWGHSWEKPLEVSTVIVLPKRCAQDSTVHWIYIYWQVANNLQSPNNDFHVQRSLEKWAHVHW